MDEVPKKRPYKSPKETGGKAGKFFEVRARVHKRIAGLGKKIVGERVSRVW